MTYSELRYELEAELDRVQPLLAIQRADTPAGKMQENKEFFELERRCFPEIDDACRFYAEKGAWPSLDPQMAILICVRVGHAVQFLEFLLECSPKTVALLPIEGLQKTTALNFLLVDYWMFAGCARWRTS